jgi:hypothetical protein
MSTFLACPYCMGSYQGAAICPHCGGDTTRDAIVEMSLAEMENEPRTTCVACNGPIFAVATRCPHCRALQPTKR